MEIYSESMLIESGSTNKSKIKLLVLTAEIDDTYTIPSFDIECKKKGIKFKIMDIDSIRLFKEDSKILMLIDKHQKPFEINPTDTAILIRGGVTKNAYTNDLLKRLEVLNFFILNTPESIVTCQNKYVTSRILMDAGVTVPKMSIIHHVDDIERAVEEIGGQFPVILKLLSGSQGIGVSIIDSFPSLKSVLQTMWKLQPNLEVLLQEKIETDYDLRIHVLTKRFEPPYTKDDSVIIGSMRRNKIEKDFRTNFSLGGTVDKTELTKEQEQMAIDSARAIGCNWCGVDLIVDKKTGKNYVLEVNSSPGTTGLKKATGLNVVGSVVDFIADTSNWNR